jgi:hypothetical protein
LEAHPPSGGYQGGFWVELRGYLDLSRRVEHWLGNRSYYYSDMRCSLRASATACVRLSAPSFLKMRLT